MSLHLPLKIGFQPHSDFGSILHVGLVWLAFESPARLFPGRHAASDRQGAPERLGKVVISDNRPVPFGVWQPLASKGPLFYLDISVESFPAEVEARFVV